MTSAWLDLIVKVSVTIVAAAAIVAVMRRSSAASRHLVWTGMFVALLIVPVARFALPALKIPVLPAIASSPAPPRASVVASSVVPIDLSRAAPIDLSHELPARLTILPVAPSPKPSSSRSMMGTVQWLAAVWLAGAAFLLIRIGIGAISVRRWARHATPVTDPELLDQLERTRTALNVRRPIALLVSPHPWMPVTWGVIRPAILVPSVLARSFADDRGRTMFDAVLAHEVAHIARWDAMSQLIAQVAVSVWWFNPLVWAAARQARLERERACDDEVLAQGTRPSEYASRLVAIVRALQPAPASTVNALAMARRSQLERRVDSILNADTDRRGRSRSSLLLTCALIVAVLPISAGRVTARAARESTHVRGADITLVESSRPPVIMPAPPVPRRARPMPQAQVLRPLDEATPRYAAVAQSDDEKWRVERSQMFRQFMERAERLLAKVKRRVEIGTSAPIETATPEQLLANIEQAALTDGKETPKATDQEKAAVRQRFAIAMRNVDAEETRFDVGLITVQGLADAMRAAVAVLRAPTGLQSARWVLTMSDADVLAALRTSTTVTPDSVRADELLWISARYALSPEMVTAYVAAANSIGSATERARVFAQPIRIKG